MGASSKAAGAVRGPPLADRELKRTCTWGCTAPATWDALSPTNSLRPDKPGWFLAIQLREFACCFQVFQEEALWLFAGPHLQAPITGCFVTARNQRQDLRSCHASRLQINLSQIPIFAWGSSWPSRSSSPSVKRFSQQICPSEKRKHRPERTGTGKEETITALIGCTMSTVSNYRNTHEYLSAT